MVSLPAVFRSCQSRRSRIQKSYRPQHVSDTIYKVILRPSHTRARVHDFNLLMGKDKMCYLYTIPHEYLGPSVAEGLI